MPNPLERLAPNASESTPSTDITRSVRTRPYSCDVALQTLLCQPVCCKLNSLRPILSCLCFSSSPLFPPLRCSPPTLLTPFFVTFPCCSLPSNLGLCPVCCLVNICVIISLQFTQVVPVQPGAEAEWSFRHAPCFRESMLYSLGGGTAFGVIEVFRRSSCLHQLSFIHLQAGLID